MKESFSFRGAKERKWVAIFLSLALSTVACGGGWQPSTPSPHRPTGPVWQPPIIEEPAPSRPVRTGPVRLEGRAFADDGGAWNALGASLFWALWGERHDPDRLDRNLAHLAEHGVDYVRIFGMVGGPSWEDRVIDPRAGDYWSLVDRLFERVARHGIRVQPTVFADAGVLMPDQRERELFAAAWAQVIDSHRDQVFLTEVANESWQDVNGRIGRDELWSLANILRAPSPGLPTALSAPQDTNVFSIYAGWDSAATLHYDRDIELSDGPFRPVRQAYGCWDEYRHREKYDGSVPPTCVSNEPIGPGASVADEQDPLRLALTYVTTMVVGNGAYVYHTAGGIRGGGHADISRGRLANIYDYDQAIIRALGHWRKSLPAGLPNWHRTAAHLHDFPWSGSREAVDRGDLMRAYGAISGDRFVGVLLNTKRPHEVTARVGLELELQHPVTGDVVHRISVAAGERFTLPADLPGYVVMGTMR